MASNRMFARARQVYRNQHGQTPTEYLMIVGLMAAVIVAVFTVAYWPNVKEVANKWIDKVKETVMGDKIQ